VNTGLWNCLPGRRSARWARAAVLSAVVLVVPRSAAALPQAAPAVSSPDGRDRTFIATAYTGLSVDTFAADSLARYLNPDESSREHARLVAGVDFAYRAIGSRGGTKQLWLFGQTMHGVRSADVNCADDATLAVCRPYYDSGSVGQRFLYILRNATSLESVGGVRYEFARVQPGDVDEARLYLKAQAGFLTVERSGGDVVDLHQIALGLLAVSGTFEGSYLEAGWGKTDLFDERRARRLKVTGLLSFDRAQGRVRPFIELTVDSDLGRGADSIQTYLGMDFDLHRIFNRQ
jgi:hypothetical protein